MEALFIELVSAYLNGDISPSNFEKKYVSLWNSYSQSKGYAIFNEQAEGVFDRIFSAIDCYCSDASLRDEDDLDEDGLYQEVKEHMSFFNKSKN